jgi:hypothetical protein
MSPPTAAVAAPRSVGRTGSKFFQRPVGRLAAIVLALLCASLPSPGPGRAHVTAVVPGLETLGRRPLLVMRSGGFRTYPCVQGVPSDLMSWTDGLFALYEDGDVIYTRSSASGCEYVEAQLPPATVPARLAAILDDAALSLPSMRRVWDHSHAPGASIEWRTGATWHRARASGVTRFGEVLGDDERPDPQFLHALRAMSSFEAEGAAHWKPREVGVWLSSGASYALDQRVDPWPPSVPEPALPLRSEIPNAYFDAKHTPTLRALFEHREMCFVSLGGSRLRLHVFEDVLPEHAYLRDVERALDRAEPREGR